MMKIRTLFLTVLCATLALSSCKKDDGPAENKTHVESTSQTWAGTEYTIKTPIEKGNIVLSVPANVPGVAKLIIPAALKATDNPNITINLAEGASFSGSLTVENADYEGTVTLQAVNNEKIAIGTATVSANNSLIVNLPKGSFAVPAGKINGGIKATTRPGTFTFGGVAAGAILIEGGSCKISLAGVISGGINLNAGATLVVEGTVSGTIKGGDITINSTAITQNIVILDGGKIKVGEGAKIEGTVDAGKASEAEIPDGTVTGEVTPPEKPTTPVTVESVLFTEPSVSIVIGTSKQLVHKISPLTATNQKVSWTSSNEAVVTVEKGLITAKALGTATITVTTEDGKKTATCEITVTAEAIAVTGVTLNKTSATLLIGGTQTLTATVTPSNATNQKVSWTSSNTTVATVSAAGVVTAKAAGTATITVTTEDGKKTATCEITVTAEAIAVTGVTLNKTSDTLLIGGTKTLTATVNPSNATNQKVSWTSSNTTVATVSAAGVVTAKATGAATITVTTEDGKKTATCEIIVTAEAIAVTGITLDKTDATLAVGRKGILNATVTPENATNKNVIWSSSDATIVSVSATGEVKGLKAGTAIITATTKDGNKTATCTIKILESWAPGSVIVDSWGNDISIGDGTAKNKERITYSK